MGKVYQNPNRILLEELVKIYIPENIDWLSYQITKNNILTLHHIIKVANGGKTEVENAALLTLKAHRALNICEYKDFILYSEIENFFKEIVKTRKPLDEYEKNESREYKNALQKVLYKKYHR